MRIDTSNAIANMVEHFFLSWGNEAAKYVYKENVTDNWINLFQFPVARSP